MKTLKESSKRAQNWINAYWHSNDILLNDCYGRWSFRKQLAYDACKKMMIDEGGWGYRIISHNTMQFTVAWLTRDGKGIRVETANNSYIIEYDDGLPF